MSRLGPSGRMRERFDAELWVKQLSHSVAIRGITWKELSAATGVSESTLSRIKDGRHPDAASLAVLSAWAGINPCNYVKAKP